MSSTYTRRLCGISDAVGSCTLDATFDSTTHYATQVTLANAMANPATLTVTATATGTVWTFTCAAGQTLNAAIPAGLFQDPRVLYPQPGPFSFSLA
jgi:hypothetical protein